MRRFLLPLAIVAFVSVPGPASAAGVGSKTPQPNEAVSKYGGWTVWSGYINETKYVLYARRSGVTKRLAAPSQAVTHDPGAGPSADGRATAVYQRCTGTRCSIWSVDLVSGKQRRVMGLGDVRRGSSTFGNELNDTHPRIWRDKIAFQTRAGGKASLRLYSGGRVRTLPRPGGSLEGLALGPKHVLAHWAVNSCNGESRCVDLQIVGIASGRAQTVDESKGSDACYADLSELRFDGRYYRWTHEDTTSDSSDTECTPATKRYKFDPATGNRTGG